MGAVQVRCQVAIHIKAHHTHSGFGLSHEIQGQSTLGSLFSKKTVFPHDPKMIFVSVVGNVEIKKIIAGEVINHDPQTSGGHTVQAVLSADISKGSGAIVA